MAGSSKNPVYLRTDLAGQLVLAGLGLLLIMFPRTIIYGIALYSFGLGGWQVLSCVLRLIRAKAGWRMPLPGRRAYEVTLGLVGIASVAVAVDGGEIVGIWLYAMLYIGVGMSVWYALLTAIDLRKARRTQQHRGHNAA